MKYYESGQGLNSKIIKGIDVLADNVASTLGPKGRNVILYHKEENLPVITKDGVTVAKFVELEDPFENVGAQIIKQAAEQTNTTAGDGTTTSTVLARAILKKAQKYLLAGSSPIDLKRGIDLAVDAIVDNLKEIATPIQSEEDIAHIATISANNDKSIGTLIATAVDRAGKDGSVLVEEARSLETSLDLIEGFRFDSGYAATAFITNQRTGAVEFDDPMILVTDEKLEKVDQILPTLELAARENRPLVIIAGDIVDQALAALIMNTVRGTMKVAAIKAPRYGEERRKILRDLCLSTNAVMITREDSLQLKDVKLAHFGGCKKLSADKGWTTIAGGKGDYEKIDEQIEALKTEIQQTESIRDCEKIQERITRLASGIAVIRVGAATEVEMIEKRHRIDDALEAVRSAQEEGIVPGGGVSLVRATQNLEIQCENQDQKTGVMIVLESVSEPIRQMAENAGVSPDVVVNMVRTQTGSIGYDFVSGKLIDMLASGIIDPVKVTRCALQNAASVSSTLITTNHAIVCQ